MKKFTFTSILPELKDFRKFPETKKIILLIFLTTLAGLGILAQDQQSSPKPKVVYAEQFAISAPLRDIVSQNPATIDTIERNPDFKNNIPAPKAGALPIGPDPVWQKKMGTSNVKWNPTTNYEGIAAWDAGGTYGIPPDTQGDVGPNHYFQVVNTSYQIWDKAGTSLVGPHSISTIWAEFAPGALSDPIVLYDEIADRWFVSIFEIYSPFRVFIAVSTTADPTGSFYIWAYPWDGQPDYAKYGIWRDGYYAGYNNGSCTYDVAVFDRSAMLAGNSNPAKVIFDNPHPTYGNCILPLDNDGGFAASGTPGQFIHFYDDAWPASSTDQIWIFTLNVNWANPSASTFSRTQTIDVSPFQSSMGPGVSQPGTTQKLNILSNQMMYRAQYRKFNTHETIVTSQVVDVDNTDHGGIRWYELRRTGGNWWVYQESTYAPDAESRYMCSIAMNGNGDMALGYSVSSTSVYPSIRYTGRLVSDPLNTMTIPEGEIFKGLHSQTSSNRWGDYSCMSVDPSDDVSFWYTNEYSNGGQNWRTRIAKINLDNPVYCAASGGCDEYISRVQMGSIDNNSACSLYADYTTLSTAFPANGSQQITITNGNPVYPTDECGIWVDWNLDGDFYDANEQMSVSGTPGVGPYTATISPPYGVTLGYYTVRIRIKYNSGLDPCGAAAWGEVEDYSIQLTPKEPNYWTGASNSYWYNDANWSLGHKPTPDEDVIILNVGYQPPIISFVNEECNNLTINTGAWVYVMETNLTVNGNMAIFGQLSMVDNNGGIVCYGDVDWNNNSTADFSASALFQVYGHWFFNSGSNAQLANGSVNFIGSNVSEVKSKSAACSFNNVYINKNYNALKIISDASQPLVINGDINIQSNSGLSNDGAADIICRGNFYNSGYYYLSDVGKLSTFIFDGTDQYIYMFSANGYFNHLKISPGLSVTLGGGIHTAGDLTIESGILDTQGNNIIVEGNWTNSVGPGAFIESTGRVIFSGSNIQWCSQEEFNELEVDNSIGALYINGVNVVCSVYDWTAGTIDVFNGGTFTANDLFDNGIFGKYVLSDATSSVNLSNYDGYVDIDGDVIINEGTMNVYGGTTPSYWPYDANAVLTMSGGILDFHDQGIYVYDSPTYTFTENITGGFIRTSHGFYGETSDFTPTAGTLEFYGSGDYLLSQANGCTLFNVNINKTPVKGNISPKGKPVIDKRSGMPMGPGSVTATNSLSTNFVITDNLTITSGELKLNGHQLSVASNLNVYGTLTLDNPNDVLTNGYDYTDWVSFYSGSTGNFSNGIVNIYGWLVTYPGCSFTATTNNTIYYKGVTGGGPSNDEPTATFGNIVIDKNMYETTYIDNFSAAPIVLNGNFTINPNNKFIMQNETMVVHGFFTDNSSSEIYVYDATKSNGPESGKNGSAGQVNTKTLGGSLTIDTDVLLSGLLDVGIGNVLIHGIFGTTFTSTVNIDGGALIADAPYYAKGWADLGGALNMTSGLFEITHNSISLITSASTNVSGGTLRTGGAFSAQMPGVFQPTGGSVEVIGSDPDNAIYCSNGNFFYDFLINRDAGAWTVYATPLFIHNDLTINSGTLSPFNNENINIWGNWINNVGINGFNEGTGMVIFSGGGNFSISPGETFNDLLIDKNNPTDSLILSGDITVLSSFGIDHGTLITGANTLDISGNADLYSAANLIIQPGGVLKLGSTISTVYGSYFSLSGNAGNYATLTQSGIGRYTCNINGEIGADYAIFEFMDGNGISVNSGATVNPTNSFNNCRFINGASSPSTLLSLSNNQIFTSDGSYFENTGGVTQYNVTKTVNNGHVTFTNATGFFAGPAYENDPNNLIDWSGFTHGLWTGAVSADWFTPENWDDYLVPDASSDVTIPSGTPNNPMVDNAIAYANNLNIQAGATLEIGSNELHITSTTDIFGELIMTHAAGKLFSQYINWKPGSTSNVTAGEIYNSIWTFEDGTNALLGTGNTVFIDSGIDPYDADAAFGNLVITNSAIKGNKQVTGIFPIRVTGDCLMEAGISWISSVDWIVNGTWEIQAGAYFLLNNTTNSICDSDMTLDGELILAVGAAFTVHGNLLLGLTGTLNISNGSLTCDYSLPSGFVDLQGTVSLDAGLLDFPDANVIISGVVLQTGGILRGGRTMVANAIGAYTPSGGMLELAGSAGSHYIQITNGNYLYNFNVNRSTPIGIYPSSPLHVMGSMDVNSAFNLQGNTLTADGGVNINYMGTLSLPSNSRLEMAGGTGIYINNGGLIDIDATPGNEAVISHTTGYYDFQVLNGGVVSCEYGIFEYMNANGIHMLAGSSVDPTHAFNNSVFQNGMAGGQLLIINNSQNFTVNNADFPTNTWGGSYNVYKSVNNGTVNFNSATGGFQGEDYDYDPYNRVNWTAPNFNLDITVFLEGPFNSNTQLMNTDVNLIIPNIQPFHPALPYFGNIMPDWYYAGTENTAVPNANVVDWVLVGIRDASSAATALPANTVAQQAAFVLSNGQVVGLDGSSLLNFTATINNGLYVVVWHRNHLGVLSANALTLSGGSYTYDFSSGSGQAYGGTTAQNLLGTGIWGMISGDGNGDGNITVDDINNVWKLQAGIVGYKAGDFNIDSEIENKDKNDNAVENMNKSSQIPE